MSTWLRSSLAIGVLLSVIPCLSAQEQEARALVEKAVKAQGGLEKLGQKVAAHSKSRGTFYQPNKFTFTGESFRDLGNRRKISLQWEQDGQATSRRLVLEDGKGFITYDGLTVDLDKEFLDRLENSVYADKVSALVTLLRDKGYKFSTLGEVPVKNAATLGVKVEKEGKPDVQLYFDKVSGLLVKSANKTKDFDSNQEVLQEVYYHDYHWFSPTAADEKLLQAAKMEVTGPALLQALRQRIPTTEELGKLYPLIEKLGHRVFSVRQNASAELATWGAKALPLLREALKHKDNEVSRRAGKVLEQIGQSPDLPVVSAILRLTTARRPPDAAAALLEYLPYAPDESISKLVLEALAAVAVRDGKTDKVVVQALQNRNPRVRAAAEAVLGKDGGVFAQQTWRPVLVDGVLLSRSSSLYRDGKLHMDLEMVEVHYYNRLDNRVFVRP